MEVQCLSLDMLSSLPPNIIDMILTLLPMQDAFRTSILSRSWRYRCLNIPKLVFDDKLFQGSTHNPLSVQCELSHVVYPILSLHHGPVLEFSLCFSQLPSCREIDHIILHLSRNNTVEKFTLCIDSGNSYKLPSSFFSLRRLEHLELQNCAFQPPSSFCGFSRLTSLCFDGVSTTGEILIRFISSCPLLKSFTLIAEDIHLTGEKMSNFAELFEYLREIEHLHMNFYPFKYFAAAGLPQKLPTSLLHLKILNLSSICFMEQDELSSALLLIQSSPNLEKMKILLHYSAEEAVAQDVVGFPEVQDVSLDHLKELELESFRNFIPELEFVKLILAKSSKLNILLLKLYEVSKDEELDMLRDLISLPRASPTAKIIIEQAM